MIEILGNELEDLFKNTRLTGICTYKGKKTNNNDYYRCEVWEVADEDFEIMCNMTEERFEAYCPNGWWRQADGSVLGVPDAIFIINGEKIKAWDGSLREHYHTYYCLDCSDRIAGLCKADEESELECYGDRVYNNLLEYMGIELGASQPKNVCALASDLAKYNNMTMAELFQKFVG